MTNALGDTLWTNTYGGSGSWSVQQTSDRGFIITGSSFQDVYLIKTDSIGNTLWTKNYGGGNIDEGRSVRQTSDGGYIIAGNTVSFGAGGWDVFLIKTDSLGDTLWTKTFGGTEDDWGWSTQQTSDGGYIIIGKTFSFGIGESDAYLIKTNSLGDTLWTRTYGGTSFDLGYSVQQTSDGGYIITGYTNSFGLGNGDIYLIKTDPLGNTLWTKTYGGASIDVGLSVHQTSDGGYVITGYTWSFGAGGVDVYLIKTDSLGDTLWTRSYGGTVHDYGWSVQQTSDGGYIIVGSTDSFGAGGSDVYLIKTDENGLIVGIEEEGSKLEVQSLRVELLQNQPNPFHFRTTIHYQIPTTDYISLKIYDLTGRLVETLVDMSHNPGVYQVEWDGKDQTSGIYFYRLSTGNTTLTKKMILLR